MIIDEWVRPKGGKWHLVESVIDDQPITRCGRRIRSKVDSSPVMPLTRMIGQPQLCKAGCDR